MSIDGSFCAEFELQRLIARCPKLSSDAKLTALVAKGGGVTDEEVVDAVAEVFINPNYTIPLVGCFRAITQRIVDKAVAVMRLVPNLRVDVGDDTGQNVEDFVGEEEIRIINFLVQSGRCLRLHELACLALCRALDLVPSLIGSVLRYFEFAPPPFERVFSRRGSFDLSSKALTYLLLNSTRTSYRLLLLETEVFSKLWDWSCFLDLVQHAAEDNKNVNDEIQKYKLDLAWCGVQTLSIVLKVGIQYNQDCHTKQASECLARCEELCTNRIGESEEASTSLFRWRDFCLDVSLEKAGWYLEPLERHMKVSNGNGSAADAHYQNIHSKLLSGSQLTIIRPAISNRRLQQSYMDKDAASATFVMTSVFKKSFEMVVLAMSQKWPVLLHGPAGSGKTALINTLARETGNQVLSIHMDDQIDAKTLIGSYVCTEQPGEFRWQPGSLTQAIHNGLWVVFEDIDKAPVDVQCILLPLLEGTNSFISGNGEVIRVAESFRLISTITTSKLDASLNARGGTSVAVLWRRVMVGTPNVDDMQKIVEAWYPNLSYISGNIVETFEHVKTGFIHRSEEPQSDSVSKFSLRDLLKWCKRIAGLGYSFSEEGLSPYICQCIYQEAVDVFASFAATLNDRLTTMKLIAKLWHVQSVFTETVYPPNKPILKDFPSESNIGRISLPRVTFQQKRIDSSIKDKAFVEIKTSMHTLERIAASVKYNEPVLLVGETGTGKTTLVQNLAARLGQKLTVLNLSQQTDVADLLGGFKPVDAQFVCVPLYKDFEVLFSKTFSMKVNSEYLTRIQKFLSDKNWRMLLAGFQKGVEFYQKLYEEEKVKSGKKRKKLLDGQLFKEWEEFVIKLNGALRQTSTSSGMIFSFVEGAFVTALQNGEWILLDEVNLAPPETLQRVIGVLEGENSSFCLAERGDIDYVYRHPNFRIFACMNPATDAGKRDLPNSLRSRFTEYYVDDVLDDEDLNLFISKFVDQNHASQELVNKIMCFYKEAKKESEERLQDGANQKPQYSLRSLYRALEYTRKANATFGSRNPSLPLYDGFAMFFLTLLDAPSAKLMEQLILKYLFPSKKLSPREDFDSYLKYLACEQNPTTDSFLNSYVLTESVKEHLRNLARAVLIRRYPVLLQGPTSSGKTSLVQYLAAKTGREFVRINNHEHTDLQEYLGSYITDTSGKLVFQEGALVKAVRNGHWIVLDELNLAPSDVLEALNRLLDDNRELYVPELCETVKAHPDFMLFATQNPPTFYAGRKMLSRAFRNRFVEIHVDDIPDNELCDILHIRCRIPKSYAKRMVNVMKELQLHRQRSKVFAGKHGFITPRDLFRWANRYNDLGSSDEDLGRDGYFLLAERLRDESEKIVVRDIIRKCLRVKLDMDDLYQQRSSTNEHFALLKTVGNITWTKSMWRLYYLVERCYKLHEPVLLVGETGGGKTTVCQLLSSVLGSKLHILNCHQYTETSDFLGGFRPLRERSKLSSEYSSIVDQLPLTNPLVNLLNRDQISLDIGQAPCTLSEIELVLNNYKQGLISCPSVSVDDLDFLAEKKQELAKLYGKWQTIFTWEDGPLIKAMKDGDLLLVDEISLADDSVLERLNSVLEPERKLSLAEKGGPMLETIAAHKGFFLLATMNPGGDYGKKELSPALRNRFTDIWVPSVSDVDELRSISTQRIPHPALSPIIEPMIHFWEWFNKLQLPRTLTVRDLLSWIEFINVTQKTLQPDSALVNGAFMVLLDGISLGTSITKAEASEVRERCVSFLIEQLKAYSIKFDECLSRLQNYGWGDLDDSALTTSRDVHMQDSNFFGIAPFFIEKGSKNCDDGRFMLTAPTTRRNAARVLRAMQLSKPVLLEGSPGVGKTSLIDALGKFSGHRVVRINLSEQTDIMDLLGSDLPVDSNDEVKFAWSDGILLQALKDGSWVLLDELNLAPQSVLEGLNAILDHRAEVYIPELGITFKCPPSFRVFACQNPSHQGGGRKGLPKSFLNRFTKVYVDELNDYDYLCISQSLHPSVPDGLLKKLIFFNKKLHEDTMIHHKFAQNGSPWEFNLRDVLRACQLIEGSLEEYKDSCFLNVIYIQRMRTALDRKEVMNLYEEVFGHKPFINPYPRVQITSGLLLVGSTTIKRNNFQSYKTSISQIKILPDIRHSLEAATQCVKHERLCIVVGPPSSGKTTLVRLLAQLTGNVLHEINLSPATDISELLGCFEQYNAARTFRSLVSQVECYMNEYCDLQLKTSLSSFIKERKEVVSKWFTVISSIENTEVTGTGSVVDTMKNFSSSLRLLGQILEEIQLNLDKMDCDMGESPVSTSFVGISTTHQSIMKLLENIERGIHPAKFEWITGVLVKAIERGDWIVLENANLCNPTVLDRINSLLEQGGSITINECGTIDGKPLIIHPHPKFRMFLTVDPKYGEVSRAMRNRGVEIYLMQPYWLFDLIKRNGDEAEYMDLQRFLVLAGIPIKKLVDMMAKAHLYARDQGLRLNMHLSYHELTLWIQLFQQLLSKGNKFIWSLQTSWEHTYTSSFGVTYAVEIIEHGKQFFLSGNELAGIGLASSSSSSLHLPGGWPAPLILRDFVLYSEGASVWQNCMYLKHLGAEYGSQESGTGADNNFPSESQTRNYQVDLKTLQNIMFPHTSQITKELGENKNTRDLSSAENMIYFALKWVIEQATEGDLELHLQWISRISSELRPFNRCMESFLGEIRQLFIHKIWENILQYRVELLSQFSHDQLLQSVPMLSLELSNATGGSPLSNETSTHLKYGIKCLSLLMASVHQWSDEAEHVLDEKKRRYQPMLEHLKALEEAMLDDIVKSPSKELVLLYIDLFDTHILFWKGVKSSQSDHISISLNSLLKVAARIHKFFRSANVSPKAIIDVLAEIKGLFDAYFGNLYSKKSLLWKHGGHPFLPSSPEIYHEQSKYVDICHSIWPRRTNMLTADAGNQVADAMVSFIPELRMLAMQGLCMSSCITEKSEEDCIRQLREMREILFHRVDHEKQKFSLSVASSGNGTVPSVISSCCGMLPEIISHERAFISYMEAVPVIDNKSLFLDMELLEELSGIVLSETETAHKELSRMSHNIENALSYALTSSSRPPIDFTPHQKILWTLDAWKSLDSAIEKATSFVQEMWFSWHSYMWSHQPYFAENLSSTGSPTAPMPHILLRPVRASVNAHILESAIAIKDYPVHCLKLRIASQNLWHASRSTISVPDFLLSVVRTLFQQIIYAYKKTFKADAYYKLKSRLDLWAKAAVTAKDIQGVLSIINSSASLASSMTHIKPLMNKLYLQSPSADYLHNIGCVWLHIGGLRFNLLLSKASRDPVLKYAFKYSHLMEQTRSLELEIKVRDECNYLAGLFMSRETDQNKISMLETLQAAQETVKKKIVFRSDPKKFKKLKDECMEFHCLIKASSSFISNPEYLDMDKVHNWQETATSFIDRLSNEYSAYADLIQPIQVAVFEMKLGVSLVQSSVKQTTLLKNTGQDSMGKVEEMVYSFVKYPRDTAFKSYSVTKVGGDLNHFHYCVDLHAIDWGSRRSLLEKIVENTKYAYSASKMINVQLQAAINQDAIIRIVLSVAGSRVLDKLSFKEMNRIFEWFTNQWMKLKEEAKIKEAFESQEYKFRPRALKTETIFEFDESILSIFSSSETFQEWQDFISQDETSETKEEKVESDSSEESWEMIPESTRMKIVQVHDRLFGSVDLALHPGVFTVPESESMQSFVDSYSLGVGIVDGLGGLSSSLLDEKLAPEHLLRLSLDLNQNKGNKAYNFYKDSNTSAVAKMVEVVTALRQRIVSLCKEWEDHPGLQKLLEVTQILLALPQHTPLDKALSGLQFLLNRIQLIQENGSKFPFADHIKQITNLASTWKKMEFDSWCSLIDEVQVECDSNAAKLWFPLYTLLRLRDTSDIDEYVKSTIESLEEFVHMSSIGEFKRRLHLLLAFHVQISRGLLLDCYSSPCETENLKILYHVLGYYMQFLPVILEHVNSHKATVQKELDELLKLCKWEHPESYLNMANTKRVRQKLKKLIQKYTNVLQLPVMVILKQEEMRRGINTQSSRVPNPLTDTSSKSSGVIDTPLNLNELDESRCLWFESWRQNAHGYCQSMSYGRIFVPRFLSNQLKSYLFFTKNAMLDWCRLCIPVDIATIVKKELTSQSGNVVYSEKLDGVWSVLKNLFSTAKGCNELWNDMNTSLGKRRALLEFLKHLESCGLSKNKSAYTEDQQKSNACSQWFLQPSYDTNHLLLKQNVKLSNNSSSDKLKVLPTTELVDEWKTANHYHFKSLASVELLRQIRLSFHTDFNLEQVRRTVSYLDHLILIQQEQRASAYTFAKQVRGLEKSLSLFRNLIISSTGSQSEWTFSFVPQQQISLQCMWQQKRILDTLCTMLDEADSLLKLAESIHLNSCQNVKPWATRLQKFIQKLVPDCRNAKEMLNHFLLDDEKGITAVGGSQQFFIVFSKQDLESVVIKNFMTLTMLKESVITFCENSEQRVSIEDTLLSRFDDIFNEVKPLQEQFQSAIETRLTLSDFAEESYSDLYAKFNEFLKKSVELAAVTTMALGYSQNDDHFSEDNIPSWTSLFSSYASKLQLEGLCDNLQKTFVYAGELIKHHDNGTTALASELGKKLKILEQLTDKLLKFSDGLLQDFLTTHKTVCALSLFLADIFASLYSKGFGNSDKQEDGCDDTSQEAKGTGMGEGVGAKDVSEQLEDEDQLLGTLEKKDEKDGENEEPGKNDKGIEMEEDFEADTYSVSEDSGEEEDDKDDEQDEQLDSAMGDTGTESAVVDEKNWDKDKDEQPDSNEKYETGSSMKDQNADDQELRGKDDKEDPLTNDASKEDLDLADGDDEKDGESGDELEETEGLEDANMDKDEAFAEPSGFDIDENDKEAQEDMDLDPQEDGNDEAENGEEDPEGGKDVEENIDETDVTVDEGEQEQVDEKSDMDNIEKGNEDDSNMDVDVNGEDASETRSAPQPKIDLQAVGSNYAPDVNWSNSSDIQNNPTSAEGLPGSAATENEIMMADASEKGRPTNDKSDSQAPEQSACKPQKNQPNPFRSIGDALQEWKERAKVTTDIGEGENDNPDDMVEDDTDEYGYVPESETGTAQALGAATSDQVNQNLNGNKAEEDLVAHDENASEMDNERNNAETNPVQNGVSVPRNKMEEPYQNLPIEDPMTEQVEDEPIESNDNEGEGLSDSLVTVKRSFVSSGIGKLNELSLSDDEQPQEANNSDVILNDRKDDASKQWRKYELRTTRLSQELAEQLRLVMQPTLASKLQGDYKTGKRINMKKVIPYIASQYRKDKIWLRRTRPNKRDYQVVIAVDDSRSMSESSCGDVAIEALVTVCRAMSQLEVGSLAVASFGKKGNVKLLHDFDQPFSGEAGVKMISSFTFKQENTIADEPVVDLLRYLNNMLDSAVSNARLPNGQNPLQQLVLIIADGRFHEKAKLRRIVRDAMSRRRLIAFLLLDSPQESIMDLMEVSFQKDDLSSPGGMKMTKYLDSFPFPYYIVLKDIDSLPRTLADLMRQWFELTQQSGD